MEQELLHKIKILEEENEKLKFELQETKEHLHPWRFKTAPFGEIKNQNKCIEVKSTWTIKDKKANIFNKQKAAKELGYNYEIWVYDKKGNKVETFI